LAKIAISYRRSDSQDITGRIFDRLSQQYGRDTVFRDIDSIKPGIDFRTQIADALTATDVLLVIVGPRWLLRSGKPPAFDCYSAVDPDEQRICRNSELAELDRNLATAYAVLRAHLDKDKQTALAADEGAWLERRKSCNKDDACIRAAYIIRLRQLRNWQ
jgi:hypothetical protein